MPVSDALKAVLDAATTPSGAIRVPLDDALHHVLAEDVLADSDQPPFDRAMMDGCAVRSADGASPRTVLGLIAAGDFPSLAVKDGECFQIMTGAPLPPGADAAQMVEKTRPLADGRVEILEAVKPGENISPRGEDFHKGDVVAAAGACVTPEVLAVLASVGAAEVAVRPKPKIALFSTGSELVVVSETPRPGQIRNTNAHALAAILRASGFSVATRETLRDDEALTRKAVEDAAATHDIVMLTGGVSMGERDFVHRVLEEAGVEVRFKKIAIKPGRPFVFGMTARGTLVFGLPGNPVSCTVLTYLFVLPALRKLAGFSSCEPTRIEASLTAPLRVRPNELQKYEPVILSLRDGRFFALPVHTNGSADFYHFSKANALAEIPPAHEGFSALETVLCVPLGQPPTSVLS